MEPPWLPPVHHNGDPSNYEEYEAEEPIQPSEIFKESDLMVSFLWKISIFFKLDYSKIFSENSFELKNKVKNRSYNTF